MNFKILLFSTLAIPMFSQTYDQLNSQLQFVTHYGKVSSKGKSNKYSGSPYYDDDWNFGTVKIKDKSFDFEAVKINLLDGSIEVLYQGEEKSLTSFAFDELQLRENGSIKKFLSAAKFKYESQNLQGFAEILGDIKTGILVNHYVSIKEPHAQAHITGGFTENRLMKSQDIFIINSGKLIAIKKKKDLEDYFEKKAKALNDYFRNKKPDIKNPGDIYQLLLELKA
jgi:acylphosphatase